MMTVDDPRHGSYAGAVAHWRSGEKPCEPCRTAALRAKKTRQLNELRAGEPATVALGPVAHSIVASTNRKILADATGIRGSRLREYHRAGPEKMVLRATRDKILAFRRPWTPVGIQRRLRALSLLGWSMRAVGDRTGIYKSSLAELRRNESIKFVRVEVAQKILDVWSELSLTIAPDSNSSRETTARAAARGWIPGLSWEDIDDPNEQPTGWSYQPAQLADRAETLTEIDDRGAGVSEACRVMHMSRDTLQQWCGRYGMSGVYRRMVAREDGFGAGNQHTEEVA